MTCCCTEEEELNHGIHGIHGKKTESRVRKVAILSLLCVPVSLCLCGSNPSSTLAVIRPAPAFELTNQDNKTVRLKDLRGQVLLVSFIFTPCSGSCPRTSGRMATAALRMEKQGLFKNGRVRLVSITLDPKRD